MSAASSSWLGEAKPIDWSDFETAAGEAAAILRRLANDRPLLTQLTRTAFTDPHLRPMCEVHDLDDKIVLVDDLATRNFRIRWRLAHEEQYERAHTHRFSFVTHILTGAHHETIYRTDACDGEAIDRDKLVVDLVKDVVAGQYMAVHHRTIHATTTTPGCVGLLLRGPAEKRRAPITRLSTGEQWHRAGTADEPEARRAEVSMDDTTYRAWTSTLVGHGLIDPI